MTQIEIEWIMLLSFYGFVILLVTAKYLLNSKYIKESKLLRYNMHKEVTELRSLIDEERAEVSKFIKKCITILADSQRKHYQTNDRALINDMREKAYLSLCYSTPQRPRKDKEDVEGLLFLLSIQEQISKSVCPTCIKDNDWCKNKELYTELIDVLSFEDK